ncbi:MAG: hypothetical protein U0325_11010 [Polyangiales bacterium]
MRCARTLLRTQSAPPPRVDRASAPTARPVGTFSDDVSGAAPQGNTVTNPGVSVPTAVTFTITAPVLAGMPARPCTSSDSTCPAATRCV